MTVVDGRPTEAGPWVHPGWLDGVVPGGVVAVVSIRGGSPADHRRAGLTAATRSLAALGAVPATILGHANDGRPLWPPGWTGSISHGAGVAVALAAPLCDRTTGVGIDVERSRALPWDDAATVLGDDEASDARDIGLDPTALWSAKEAAFKAWSHACGGLPGVDPVEMRARIVPRATRDADRVTLAMDLLVEASGGLARRLQGAGVSGCVDGRMLVSDRILTVARVV